jgi:outer membrane protein assembly factor BamD
MIKLNFILLVFLIFFNFSCSKEVKKESLIKEKNIELQVLEAYSEGLKELEAGDVLYAAKKFNEVEIMFPQSIWAPRSTLMAAYAYYSQDYYFDAIEELKIFLRKYPNHESLDYAHYMMALTYYEQIVDEKKDLNSIILAKKKFEYVIKEFSNTDYALDSKFKLDLINDILASKEMYLGRYYFDKKKWIPSINRFRKVVDDYSQTIYVEEALHRLVEVHYTLGLVEEASKYANLLGYNYQSSDWYKKTYGFFNKTYEKNRLKQEKKSKENIVKRKFKSLFE